MSPSPISKLRTGSGANLLEKLVMDVEQGTRLVAHTEEVCKCFTSQSIWRNPSLETRVS